MDESFLSNILWTMGVLTLDPLYEDGSGGLSYMIIEVLIVLIVEDRDWRPLLGASRSFAVYPLWEDIGSVDSGSLLMGV